MEEETKEPVAKIKEEVEKQIANIAEDGIENSNLDVLYKLVDIHKDIENEEYWKKKEENIMAYRDGGYGESYNEYGYGNYGRRGVPGSGRGGYRGEYGRRGVKGTGRGRYRGDEMIDEMAMAYGEYSDGKEEFGRGNYGAKDGTMKSLDYMLQSVCEFMEMLKKDASSQEEMELIQEYARKIGEM